MNLRKLGALSLLTALLTVGASGAVPASAKSLGKHSGSHATAKKKPYKVKPGPTAVPTKAGGAGAAGAAAKAAAAAAKKAAAAAAKAAAAAAAAAKAAKAKKVAA